jgi:hypothetical protein
MRFRLRTLLIALMLGPPALAGAWWLIRSFQYPSEAIHLLVLAALIGCYFRFGRLSELFRPKRLR